MIHATTLPYFSPLLPWQKQVWQNLSTRVQKLPHGLLFAGMSGIGKRQFVWHFVAWLLCENRNLLEDTACGQCQSCQWLQSGTHPDLTVLPATSLPSDTEFVSNSSNTKTNKKNKANKSSKDKGRTATNTAPSMRIKIDDIRQLQPFVNQGSNSQRICVIDYADKMTVAAANALLKTLEEPRARVILLLISDAPTNLLPTIKSRVQDVGIHQLAVDQTQQYLSDKLKHDELISIDNEDDLEHVVSQALLLANGAPLAALTMLSSDWYAMRAVWVKTWLALRSGKRSVIAASDYWQKQLSLQAFVTLSEQMLMDISRCSLGIAALQQDLNLAQYELIASLPVENIYSVMSVIENVKQADQQNIQPKLGFDKLLSALQTL